MPVEKTIRYPGCLYPVGVTIVRTVGVVPDAYTLRFLPQPSPIARTGTLQVTCGNAILRIPDCIVAGLRHVRGERGRFAEATLLDGRWRWRYGAISGEYNIPDPDGRIIPRTERTPQQLAELLLRAIGVTDYDVGQLPNDDRPRVEWDYDLPARRLEELCLERGCVISYKFGVLGTVQQDVLHAPVQPFPAGRVVVERLGAGAPLRRNSDLQHISVDADPKERPDSLLVAGASVLHETVLWLEPVAHDRDGKIKPVEELSYRPPNNVGWTRGTAPVQAEADKELARDVACMYRVQIARAYVRSPRQVQEPLNGIRLNGDDGWRLQLPARNAQPSLKRNGEFLPIPDGQTVTVEALWQILPIEDHLATFRRDPRNGDVIYDEPYVFGVFAKEDGDNRNNANTVSEDNKLRMSGNFRIDREQGLVIFNRPIWRRGPQAADGTTLLFFPIILLRTCVPFRDFETGGLYRYHRWRQVGFGAGTGPRVVPRPDLEQIWTQTFTYGESSIREAQRFTNTDRLDPLADAQIDATLREYQDSAPGTARYRFLQPFETDGAIREVLYQVGDGSLTTTTVSRSDEMSGLDYKLDEKRVFGWLFENWEWRGEGQGYAQSKMIRRHSTKR